MRGSLAAAKVTTGSAAHACPSSTIPRSWTICALTSGVPALRRTRPAEAWSRSTGRTRPALSRRGTRSRCICRFGRSSTPAEGLQPFLRSRCSRPRDGRVTATHSPCSGDAVVSACGVAWSSLSGGREPEYPRGFRPLLAPSHRPRTFRLRVGERSLIPAIEALLCCAGGGNGVSWAATSAPVALPSFPQDWWLWRLPECGTVAGAGVSVRARAAGSCANAPASHAGSLGSAGRAPSLNPNGYAGEPRLESGCHHGFMQGVGRALAARDGPRQAASGGRTPVRPTLPKPHPQCPPPQTASAMGR